ncbi:hypothetical protein SUGI_0081900 [Cryptomeria japonica]|nr:hypothetical protein SUGI_0081900 [Cryptomeria japonica]
MPDNQVGYLEAFFASNQKDQMKNDQKSLFPGFECHTKGIGMKLLTKMGYSEKGLGVNEQGMINSIEVKERPHYQELGYGETRESSKAFRKENSLVNTSNYSSANESLSSPKRRKSRGGKRLVTTALTAGSVSIGSRSARSYI